MRRFLEGAPKKGKEKMEEKKIDVLYYEGKPRGPKANKKKKDGKLYIDDSQVCLNSMCFFLYHSLVPRSAAGPRKRRLPANHTQACQAF